MLTWLREALVTVGVAVFVAGPVAAVTVPLLPEGWRRPPLVWGILLGAVALVAGFRRRRWRRR